ncbi:hypothetical protein L6R50_07110 [Myxococcota bacterium]|nr:hypothetical protein [Myxococcota bacterium]
MLVQVHAPGPGADDAVRARVYECIVEPLGRKLLDAEGTRLVVYIEDVNGTKGGEDKLCRAVLHVPHGPSLTVSGIAVDVMGAVDDVGRRLERSYDRAVGRRVDSARHPKKYYVARLEEERGRADAHAPGEPAEPAEEQPLLGDED